MTALMFAALNDNFDIVQLLLASGANRKIKDT